jgi:hypothetical protein
MFLNCHPSFETSVEIKSSLLEAYESVIHEMAEEVGHRVLVENCRRDDIIDSIDLKRLKVSGGDVMS